VKNVEFRTKLTTLLKSSNGIKVFWEIELHLLSMLFIANSIVTLVNSDVTSNEHPINAALRGHHSVAGPRVYNGPARSTRDQIRSTELTARVFSASAILRRVRFLFSALYLWQTKARAFSAFESTEGSGVLGLYPCKVRAFPVLPPLNLRLGRSRPSSLHQSTGVPGSASV